MSTSSFQVGTQVIIEGKQYLLLRKLDADTWQLEEVRCKRIVEFSENKLLRSC